MTKAEIILWDKVLRKDKTSYRFLRQKILGPFIADFYCSKLMLVIEVDGESHIGREEYDAQRTQYLNELGIKIIRFMNRDVEMNINQCILLLKEELHKRHNELYQIPPG